MPVRNTSKASFLAVNESGKAWVLCARIKAIIAAHAGITRREIFNILKSEKSRSGNTIEYSDVSARCTDLKKKYKLIEERGCKKNPDTGHSANLLFVSEEK